MTAVPPPQLPPEGFHPVPPPAPRPPSVFREHFVAVLICGVVLVIAVGALAVWSATSIMASRQQTTTSAPAGQVPRSAVPQSSSSGMSAQDQQFLGMLRALPEVPPVTNPASMISGAHDVCADLERGVGAGAETYSIAGQAGISVNAAGSIVGASIMVYCPQHRAAAGL